MEVQQTLQFPDQSLCIIPKIVRGKRIIAGEYFELAFESKNMDNHLIFPGGTVDIKISFESNNTYFSTIINIPKLVPLGKAKSKIIKTKCLSAGPIMFYSSNLPAKWNLLNTNFSIAKTFDVQQEGNWKQFVGNATSFDILYAYDKSILYVKYTLWASLTMLIVTLLLFFLTLIKIP